MLNKIKDKKYRLIEVVFFYLINISSIATFMFYGFVNILAAGFMSAGGAAEQIDELFIELFWEKYIFILLALIVSFMIGRNYIIHRKYWLILDIISQIILGIISGFLLINYLFIKKIH